MPHILHSRLVVSLDFLLKRPIDWGMKLERI